MANRISLKLQMNTFQLWKAVYSVSPWSIK